ncbi:hypothetical protein [Fastidiosibacter lacustris]|uniref:hypothetical protein n=1 Tax=Fastidiosibacter lacustris TaxID=2056695 RepID=UPI00130090C5|nr:hypothetical protein [Fastidiosibacter lacustris]
MIEGDPSGYESLPNINVVKIDGNNVNDETLTVIIGDSSEKTFYNCNLETCSSLFSPNFELMDLYNNISEWLTVISYHKVSTKNFKDLHLSYLPDYTKSDLQGSNLMTIQYGGKYTDHALVIEVEVEFIQQYVISEIEQVLREKRVKFHTFTGYGSRLLKPMLFVDNPFQAFNQWMWGHAVFIKDITGYKKLSEEKLYKLSQIAHNVYSSYDLSAHCLSIIDNRIGSNLVKRYLSSIKEVKYEVDE